MTRAWHQHMRRAKPEDRTVHGEVLDSGGEAKRYADLLVLQRSGAISNLRRQVRFPLVLPNGRPVLERSQRYKNGRRCHYTADFAYTENGQEVIEEYKGVDEPLARLRRAVAEAIYGFEIRITGPAVRPKRRKDKRNVSLSACLTLSTAPTLTRGRRD